MDYLGRALGAWFVGFFPLAEIYVAVPAALATGLDSISTVFWTVFGNFTPVLLVHLFYDQLMRVERIRNWMSRLVSDKLRDRLNRYGTPFVLLMTPWTGVWVMAVTVKVLGISSRKFLPTALISITVCAIALVALIQLGVTAVNA
jgi:uncharacterized membrane protein